MSLLLFNIFLNDIFLFITNSNSCNYADDNTLYVISKNLHAVKSNIKANVVIMQKWFYENLMVLNPGKCHYILIGNHDEPDKINLNIRENANNTNEKLLAVLIDKKLNFNVHIKTLCEKAEQKLNSTDQFSCKVTVYLLPSNMDILFAFLE